MFTKTLCCCSHKCLYGEADAALIEKFYIGTGNGTPCRGKIASYLEETFFLFWLIIAS